MPTRIHDFHAEAKIIDGVLHSPLERKILPQAHTQLPKEGGYLHANALDYRLERVLSFASAYTHVAGNPGRKPREGWKTLCTTVVEGLNVMEVLTADRVVGQIITEHPLEGHVPSFHFLGTRFENLRIAGKPVDLDLDLTIFGDKPENDGAYTKHQDVINRISNQYKRISASKDLPDDLAGRYNQLASSLGSPETVQCSLVNQAAGSYPGRTFGHIIRVRDFGTITLGKVNVTHSDFNAETGISHRTLVELTMIDLKLGCAVDGDIPIGNGGSNGSTH
jgi:hypothetical protein